MARGARPAVLLLLLLAVSEVTCQQLSEQAQINSTRFTEFSCNSKTNAYEFQVSNFFTFPLTDFRVELLCDGDSVASTTFFSLPGTSDSLSTVGTLTAKPSSGSVLSRICVGQLYTSDPFPTDVNNIKDILLDSKERHCGDTIVFGERGDVCAPCRDDDDDSPMNVEASLRDGRTAESPVVFWIASGITWLVGIAAVSVLATNRYTDYTNVLTEASGKASSKAREQTDDELRPVTNISSARPQDAPYSNGGGIAPTYTMRSGASFHGKEGGGGTAITHHVSEQQLEIEFDRDPEADMRLLNDF